MVDTVLARSTLPRTDVGWKEAIRARCVSARAGEIGLDLLLDGIEAAADA